MKTICINVALLLAATITINAQEPLQRENRRTVLQDDINGERILNLRQNTFQLDTLAGLSNEQREQIRQLQAEMQNGLNRLNNQLREKQIRLQTLEKQNVVNMKAINKNIDEQAKLLAEQMKMKANYKQKIRALLDEEQRGRFMFFRNIPNCE
jgi:septal ring factor EnvC (AmiA/AmiB activator)